MAREYSLTFRDAIEADATDQIPVILVTITHPDIAEPIRLSTDPTMRLSVDPLRYGTVSRGETFLFVPMVARLPDETDEAPLSTELRLANLDAAMVKALRQSTRPASATLEMVLAASPDLDEESVTGLKVWSAEADLDEISLSLARQSRDGEPWPCDRMTASAFPGLFR
ncbi:hypothetical protein [Ancylobacter lacus]|uniref:hypothetical protein n=1 Tax=Ancylobacter lacus TaxID=2579970 RepID=UPI001BCBE466|nr:hypothetical protein [Ancylobacter lacus]MBS7538354.1 hypothetical protein [Ancylobacter lacus]